MTLAPDLAEIRFGTGLASYIRPPRDIDTMMDRLLGPDIAASDWPQPGWRAKVGNTFEWARLRRARTESEDARNTFRAYTRTMQKAQIRDLTRMIARAATTDDGFRERLWWFWTDHFAVANGNGFLRMSAVGYYEDAIRPNMTGRFADLLFEAVTHPAMLDYLDANVSVGPGSRRARSGDAGLNENLSRELLELHTLGADGGYGQSDVRELAKLLAGLSIDRKTGLSQFRDDYVEPGAEQVLGRRYDGEGVAPIRAVLEDLSVHPSTARHISTKLARHFVADLPDPDLVATMTDTWTRTGGDLPSVYLAMLTHPASAVPMLQKVRRPLDLIAAAARALDAGPLLMRIKVERASLLTRVAMLNMGQTFMRPAGPDGFPEEAEAWITPQGLAARIDWAMDTASKIPDPPDPRQFVDWALGRFATPRTRFAAEAAETRADGIGLVLAAPEFQRR